MSGRTKRILYTVFDCILWLGAIVGVALILLYAVPSENGRLVLADRISCYALLCCVLLRVPVLLHELGHLLFGLLVGMKPISFTVSLFRIAGGRIKFIGYSQTAGATEAVPNNGKHVRGKFITFALGGGVLNLLVGGVMLALFLILPYHAGLLFCGLLALFFLAEGIRAFLPCELPAGKTDGARVIGALKRAPEEEVLLRVLTAQGILYRGNFSELPQELLFEAPVVREDSPQYHALLELQYRYLLSAGENARAVRALNRLESLSEYFSEEQNRLLQCELAYCACALAEEPNAAKAQELLEEGEKGCAAYYRAAAAIAAAQNEPTADLLAAAERAQKKEPLNGVRALERALLSRFKRA